ncbi:MAG TPA: hypothetical protein VFW50_37950 [Streptosporangiaceae bacterium]|nr:hypothetical protein [Streptosporangiaceae bacterium]
MNFAARELSAAAAVVLRGEGGAGGAWAEEFDDEVVAGFLAGVIAGLERDLAGGLDPASADLLWRGLRAVTERAEAAARETGARSGPARG